MGILIPDISILEKIIRPAVVYVFLLIAFRIAGKRELGQMTPFDLVVLLTISNVVQNAMIGPDNSLGGGLIGAATLLFGNGVLARLSYYFPRLEHLIEGEPTILIENGKILEQNLRRELLTIDDLREGLRKNQVDLDTDMQSIHRAELEPDGSITITRNLGVPQGKGIVSRHRGKMRRQN